MDYLCDQRIFLTGKVSFGAPKVNEGFILNQKSIFCTRTEIVQVKANSRFKTESFQSDPINQIQKIFSKGIHQLPHPILTIQISRMSGLLFALDSEILHTKNQLVRNMQSQICLCFFGSLYFK